MKTQIKQNLVELTAESELLLGKWTDEEIEEDSSLEVYFLEVDGIVVYDSILPSPCEKLHEEMLEHIVQLRERMTNQTDES